ncbi:hypothetical protein F0562_022822 [Nyssa sinensis]|uniref:RING-type E3 ubiquitin transferase n=1 Tax=Nyssa sinensis TaxID=561372 RepID=A0A5J5BHC6_9ASTE|nr:hypothetical protein F0562_022822 [Nyssa sinensis]
MTLDSSSNECNATTVIAIDKDRNSQVLLHAKTLTLPPQDVVLKGGRSPTETELQQLFLPHRGYCARKGIQTKDVILHDINVPGALVDFITNNSISSIVVGASNRSALTRAFRNADVPTSLSKNAPDFCSVYVLSKGKLHNVRSASRTSYI